MPREASVAKSLRGWLVASAVISSLILGATPATAATSRYWDGNLTKGSWAVSPPKGTTSGGKMWSVSTWSTQTVETRRNGTAFGSQSTAGGSVSLTHVRIATSNSRCQWTFGATAPVGSQGVTCDHVS